MKTTKEYPILQAEGLSNLVDQLPESIDVSVMTPDHIYRVKKLVLIIVENEVPVNTSKYHDIYKWLDMYVTRFQNRYLTSDDEKLYTNTPSDSLTQNIAQMKFLKTIERFNISEKSNSETNTSELLNVFFLLQDAMNIATWLDYETKIFLYENFIIIIDEFNKLLDKEILRFYSHSLRGIEIHNIWNKLERKTWDNCSEKGFEDVKLIVRIINEFNASLRNPSIYLK